MQHREDNVQCLVRDQLCAIRGDLADIQGRIAWLRDQGNRRQSEGCLSLEGCHKIFADGPIA